MDRTIIEAGLQESRYKNKEAKKIKKLDKKDLDSHSLAS
ncbi:hypothetical protein FHW88_000660 [Mucilaginibacter sp. SG538B]|jgi:hypothetical protein|nr:hypothetical protein [Mucilaginibacter sp. SG538B]